MSSARSQLSPDQETYGDQMYALMAELLPICRSITGDGVRETLRILARYAPIESVEVPSGAAVYDWTVPPEWNVREAFIKGPDKRIVADFADHNLHVVNYSTPIRQKMTLAELMPHLFTIEKHPDWIPYRTSYYKRDWGFCLSHNTLTSLRDGEYEVCIDSKLEEGSLTYGECFLAGESSDEILISTHVCHPSMCNDNLSGVVVTTLLARLLAGRRCWHSVRVLFVPGCIGPIAWLARNERKTQNIRHGLVLACLGDSGAFTYKRSRRGDALIDRASAHVLAHSSYPHKLVDFTPWGYDERQYCSPGFNLPVGCFMRTAPGQFEEYHTSADNLDFVRPSQLQESLNVCLGILDVLEHDSTCINLNPMCEPQLGRRGLYRTSGGAEPSPADLARLWVLNYSDGHNTLLEIAVRSGLPFHTILAAAGELRQTGLLSSSIQ